MKSCSVCGKTLSRNQTCIYQDMRLCLDCAIDEARGLGEDDRIEVSVDLVRRVRAGIVYRNTRN